MKSLREYSLNITEEQYHALPSWSYSTISRYAKEGFAAMESLHESVAPTPAMEFGSLFDSIITKGMEATEKEYAISDVSVPPAEKKVLDMLHERFPKSRFEKIMFADIVDAANAAAYQPKWKDETRVAKLEAYKNYLNMLTEGKKVVSSKDWQDAIDMTYELRSNPCTGQLFKIEDTEDIEYLYQLKFEFPHVMENGETVMMKFMPDLVIVNHREKTIQPVDLKTSATQGWNWWKENFIKYRYDIQAHLYSDGLREVTSHIPGYEDYTILPYLFADISRSDMQPVTYRYDQTDFTQADGFSFESNGKQYTYKRWDKLLEEIKYYEENESKVPVNIDTNKPNDILELFKNAY